MVDGAWEELRGAALDAVRADCRQHRERARMRLTAALDAIGDSPDTEKSRESLTTQLAVFVADQEDEDPEAARLCDWARAAGVLPPRRSRG